MSGHSLILAIFRTPGNHEVVDELLRSEADTHVPDDDEKTLLDVAKQHSKLFEEEEKKIEKMSQKQNLFFQVTMRPLNY